MSNRKKSFHTYTWHEFDKAQQVLLEIVCVATNNCTANHSMHTHIHTDRQKGQHIYKTSQSITGERTKQTSCPTRDVHHGCSRRASNTLICTEQTCKKKTRPYLDLAEEI